MNDGMDERVNGFELEWMKKLIDQRARGLMRGWMNERKNENGFIRIKLIYTIFIS